MMAQAGTYEEGRCGSCGALPAFAVRWAVTLRRCVPCVHRDGVYSDLRSLLRPLRGGIVVLPDKPTEKRGLIIIPRTVFEGGKLREEQTISGLVVSVGPGWRCKPLQGEELVAAPGVPKLKPMGVEAGQRVVLRAVHKEAFTDWRGLVVATIEAVIAVEGS